MNKNIEVAVIIPAYNAEKTLLRAFLSTVNQGIGCQVVIINDQSNDQTLNIANEISDNYPDVLVLNNDKNLGVSASRNKGIKAVDTEYIAFLDADDVWLPNKLLKQKRSIENTDNCILVTCDSLQISPCGKVLKRAHLNKRPVTGFNAWKTLLEYNFIPTPTVFTRTALVKECMGFDENLKVAEDLNLWIKLAMKGQVTVINEVLVHYFDYQGSLMKTGEENPAVVIIDMIKQHIDNNPLLTRVEMKNIYSKRYFELGLQNLNDFDSAKFWFGKSIKYGIPSWKVNKILLRALLKNKFNDFFSNT
jgi:glycosyltransferase involved in cell wall biosynthesis